MTEPTNDNPQLSLGAIVANLPAVKVAKKANTMSRVHRRLIEPIETEQDNEPQLAFQHTVFCQTSLPYRNPGDDVRKWKRTNGSVVLQLEAGDAWNVEGNRLTRQHFFPTINAMRVPSRRSRVKVTMACRSPARTK